MDNFELIKQLFYFNEANNMFFHCQIIIRPKDHKLDKIKRRVIKTYFVTSKEYLDKIKDEVILLCEHYGARAYINVAGKDFEALQKALLVKFAKNIAGNIIQNPKRLLDSEAGKLKSRIPKWVIDVDDTSKADEIKNWIEKCHYREGYKIYATIPTKNGLHFITSPFDSKAFNITFPNIDVHKNNPTVLYVPRNLETIQTNE